ncbi:TetR/AcrR family transcriptional regulator [Nocardiopsis alba]|uniref:TetR/AcrR family transcriptional regulator n=1 Tax=Nocardiopsis alba TaxID=53437 RepID=UPI0036704AF5
MARSALDSEALLEASRRCAQVFTDQDTTPPPVRRLASAAGMSERTFHRYFPSKEDCLRPVLAEGTTRFAAALSAQEPGRDLTSAVIDAFETTYRDDPTSSDAYVRELMTRVFEDDLLRRVWLQATYDAGHLLRPSIAALLGTPLDDLRTTTVSGQAALLHVITIEKLVADGTPLCASVRPVATMLFGPPKHHP